ncbi:midnolin-like isoform X2 [Oncorhynchus clarkii lewisi]|uniref:midnolin-like isoform X2 n=1 Tax=Oncorhynchus clarkii lewisi TaxID=490388 RepID=UPI0039B99A40
MDHPQPGTRSFIPRAALVCASVPTESFMRLSISSTTGSRFELSVHRGETVEVLRRRLSQKLRVPKERFVLLHKETRLSTGKLHDLGIVDGSKLTLVPTIEAGLLSSQPSRREQTIMQALESLTETQVSDFLSGRSPLTLALRGDCSVAGTPTSNKTAAGEPGAVIESFVSHAPGVFSGTFSGTLPPAGQDSTSTGVKSSRRGINTIFQILNDLLSATRHYQGAPLSLSQLLCRPPSTPTSSTPSTPTSPFPPPSPLTPDLVSTATSGPLTDHISQKQSHSCKPTAGLCSSQSEEENQSLRCKLERLQMLMHQRRLRRRARRDTRTSHPYPPHRQPWSPGRDKASRHSNGSLSSSEGSSLDDLELQWKPELPSDLVMA